MRITVLHRYFWPQNYPYAIMLKEIVETLVASGNEIKILTTIQGGDSECNLRKSWKVGLGVDLNELRLGQEKKRGLLRKGVNAIYFALWIFWKLISGCQDVVLVGTTPPIIVATVVRWGAKIRGYKYVYHCQDIHPEAMRVTGSLKRSWFYKWLLNMDKKNIDQAWKVITLSADMCNTFERRGCRVEHVEVINNFIFEEPQAEVDVSVAKSKIKFIFSGSLGRLQNLEVMISSFEPFKNREDVDFVIMGEGILRPRLEELKSELDLKNVTFVGQKSLDDALAAMREADVGLVSLSPGVIDVAYPSKTIMYMASGLPVLAIVDEDTDLARLIVDKDLGDTAPPDSISEISKAIDKLVRRFHSQPIQRQYVQKTAYNLFGKEVILKKLERVLNNESEI